MQVNNPRIENVKKYVSTIKIDNLTFISDKNKRTDTVIDDPADIVELSKEETWLYEEHKKIMSELMYWHDLGERSADNYYDLWLNDKAYKTFGEDTNEKSIKTNMENHFKAYAACYDEIVRGHRNGTRNSEILDKDGTIRKLTADEEIARLNKAYKNYVDVYTYFKTRKFADLFVEAEQQAFYYSDIRMESALKNRAEIYSLPEHLDKCLMNAAKEFVIKYNAMDPAKINYTDVLPRVNLFSS